MAKKGWFRFDEDDDDRAPRVVYVSGDRDRQGNNISDPILDVVTKAVQQEMMKKFFKEEKKDKDEEKKKEMFKGLSKTDIFNLMLLGAPLITFTYWMLLSTLMNLAFHFK